MFRRRPGINSKLDALRTLYGGKKLIVGRDKKSVLQILCFLILRPKNLSFLGKKKKNSTRGLQVMRNPKVCFRIILNGLGSTSLKYIDLPCNYWLSRAWAQVVSEIVAHMNGNDVKYLTKTWKTRTPSTSTEPRNFSSTPFKLSYRPRLRTTFWFEDAEVWVSEWTVTDTDHGKQ